MSVEINEKLLGQMVGQIKNQDDLADLSRQLIKAAVERVMAVELEEHLGYAKHSAVMPNTLPTGITRETVATVPAKRPSKVTLVSWKSIRPETVMANLNLSSLPKGRHESTSLISKFCPSTHEE